MRTLIALLVLACCAFAQATPLSPEVKAALAKGTKDSCLSTQAKDPGNKKLTIAKLQDYCDCYGNGFAGSMQFEDIEKNKDNFTPETLKMIDVVSNKCIAAVLTK